MSCDRSNTSPREIPTKNRAPCRDGAMRCSSLWRCTMWLRAWTVAALLGAMAVGRISLGDTIIDTFNGPSLDPAWSVIGNSGNFTSNPGFYTVSADYPQSAGLIRTLGVGDAEVMIRYGSVTGLAGANVRLDINDGPGWFVIMAEAPRNGSWGPNIVIDWNNGVGPNNRLLSQQFGGAISDLAFDIRWTESTQTFSAKYSLNGSGWSQDYSAFFGVASSPTRTVSPWIIAWDSGPGTTPAELNTYTQTTSSVPEIDPNSLGSILALVLGSLGLLERRRLKAA